MNAVFAADAEIGSDAVFAADAEIGSDAVFTADSGLGSDAVFAADAEIGSDAVFAANAEIGSELIFAADVSASAAKQNFAAQHTNRQRISIRCRRFSCGSETEFRCTTHNREHQFQHNHHRRTH